MLFRMLAFVAVGAALFMTAPAFAQGQTPEAFLRSIYGTYKGENEGGVSLEAKVLPLYFTPELAGLIAADGREAVKRNEVPKLDGDPFINAQEWKITDLAIKVEETPPGSAVGMVSFRNYGEADAVKVDLVKLPQGWRVADIATASGRLKELFGK